jgi:hypothetical protein
MCQVTQQGAKWQDSAEIAEEAMQFCDMVAVTELSGLVSIRVKDRKHAQHPSPPFSLILAG